MNIFFVLLFGAKMEPAIVNINDYAHIDYYDKLGYYLRYVLEKIEARDPQVGGGLYMLCVVYESRFKDRERVFKTRDLGYFIANNLKKSKSFISPECHYRLQIKLLGAEHMHGSLSDDSDSDSEFACFGDGRY